MTRARLVALLFGIVAGCADSDPKRAAAPTGSAALPSSPNSPQDDIVAARVRVASAHAAFGAAVSDTPDARLSAFSNLLRAIDAAKPNADLKAYDRVRVPTLVAAVERLEALNQEAAANTTEPAPAPEKPEYDGAFYLHGSIKRCYGDGVLLVSGNTYYFLRDGACPTSSFVTRLEGYVEKTGETETADIGRDGREAHVVILADREKMLDDKAAFATAMAEYREALRERTVEIAARNKALGAIASERSRLRSQIDPALKRFADRMRQTLDVGLVDSTGLEATDVSEPSQEVAQAQIRDKRARRPTGAPTTEWRSGSARDNPSSSRASCVGDCVSGCSDDTNCERACVARRCRRR
jgi:hypothetical protein